MPIKAVLCHCCGLPSGKPQKICNKCIGNGGSIERKCSKHPDPITGPDRTWEFTIMIRSKGIYDFLIIPTGYDPPFHLWTEPLHEFDFERANVYNGDCMNCGHFGIGMLGIGCGLGRYQCEFEEMKVIK